MTNHSAPAQIDARYADLEAEWSVTDRTELAGLVVPNGNGTTPVHRWFRMKEAFSCELLERVLEKTGLDSRDSLSVYDPFAGSGTTAVSLAATVEEQKLKRAHFVGLETNPYLHLVAATKLGALQSPPTEFSLVAQRIMMAVGRRAVDPAPPPRLSTFVNPRYFRDDVLGELLRLRAAIDREAQRESEPLAVDLARVCLGAIVEGCSSLRRDGRALRYESKKPVAEPLSAFRAKAEEVEEDLRLTPTPITGAVHRLDARDVSEARFEAPPFDLILFSPPYPNNIDYTEVYKLEAWLLGFYEDHHGFRAQRWRTLRSHPSLDFGEGADGLPEELVEATDTLLEPLLDSVPDTGRYTHARRRTIRGYAYDMLQTLRGAADRTRAGARLVYVVGNSIHGGRNEQSVVIAADVLIGRLANLAGFDVDELCVARAPLRRRSASPYLRESIVFCTRRSGG